MADATITQQINRGKAAIITAKTFMSQNIIKTDSDTYLIINIESILSKYRSHLKAHTYRYRMSDEEMQKYEYRVNLLSYDMYGTIEMIPFILAANNMVSETDFGGFRELNLLDQGFIPILNEILIKERRDLNKMKVDFRKEVANL